MSKINTKQILMIAVLVLVLLGAGYYFMSGDSEDLPLDLLIPSETEVVGEDVLLLVEQLDSIIIDEKLFSSSLFTNLRDTSVTITPEAQGRPNPFGSIGTDAGSQASTFQPIVQ